MKHEMLMACEMNFAATGEALAYGFRKAGWCVAPINLNSYFPSVSILSMRALMRAATALSIQNYNEAILNQFEQLRPSVFVTVKGNYIKAETLKKIRSAGALTVNYYPDVHFEHNGYDLSALSAYDLFATTKSFHLNHIASLGFRGAVKHIPHGYSDLVHHVRPDDGLTDGSFADVAYFGNHSTYKQEWLSAIVERLGHLRLRIVGYRWKEAVGGGPLEPYILGSALTGDFYSRAIRGSKINIGLHSGPSGSNGWEDLVSTRTFEIPASRGFMLHIDNPEVRSLFESETEIGLFSTPDDLCGQIERYMAAPDLRLEMIERAYTRAVPAYGHFARAEQLLREIEALWDARHPTAAAPQGFEPSLSRMATSGP